MYKVKVNYTNFLFDTLTNAMTFVGMVLNSAMDDYDVTISKENENREEKQ